MNIAIIYHDADFDGILSREVCLFHLRREYPSANLKAYGWDYGRPLPGPGSGEAFTSFDRIFIVDLSVDELMFRPELSSKIVWIDHHKSAIEKWDPPQGPKFFGYRIDGVAACRLCWQWFLVRREVSQFDLLPLKHNFIDREVDEPALLRLAGEYDIWDQRDPDAKVLQFGLRALGANDLSDLVHSQFTGEPGPVKLDNVIAQGRSIKSYCDKQNDDYSRSFSQTIYWEGLCFCALNLGQRGNSDLLRGGIKPEHDACFAWRWTGKEVLVSLYHIQGKTHHDLSLIAAKHGGGGHKGACGFRITMAELECIINP